jgi:hypothetical protein
VDKDVAFGEVKLKADFVPAAKFIEAVDEADGAEGIGVIEGDDEAWVHSLHHPGIGTARREGEFSRAVSDHPGKVYGFLPNPL